MTQFGYTAACVLAAETRAWRNKRADIEDAAARLRDLMDGRGHPAA